MLVLSVLFHLMCCYFQSYIFVPQMAGAVSRGVKAAFTLPKWISCSERCALGVAQLHNPERVVLPVSISKDQFLICSSKQWEKAYGNLMTIPVYLTMLVICLWLYCQFNYRDTINLHKYKQCVTLAC